MGKTVTEIEQEWQTKIREVETATFGMGCFWGPDARFGALPGVIRTRTGFAGGTTKNPVYRNMGDHTETIQIDFDPRLLSFEDLLLLFWNSHKSTNRTAYKDRQYLSLLFYHDDKQKNAIQKIKTEIEARENKLIETEIQAYSQWTQAENRHQKYHLKRFGKAAAFLETCFSSPEDFVHATLTARLNGFVKEFTRLDDIKAEIMKWEIEEASRQQLFDTLARIRW